MTYKLTSRGIWFVRMLLVILASGMIYFGGALLQHFEWKDIGHDEEQSISLPSSSNPVLNQPKDVQPPKKENAVSTNPGDTYTPYQLEDLKTFKMDFEFAVGEEEFTSQQLKELNYLLEVLKQYPKEPITLAFNGVKTELSKKIIQHLGTENYDENLIEVRVMDDALRGEVEKASIAIYFTNHYHLAKNAK